MNPPGSDNMYYGASKEIFQRAEELRSKMTLAEEKLWTELSKKQLDGHKFRRQHPLHLFIADFYCHQRKLVIEIDGGVHEIPEQKEYDVGRSEELTRFGIKVIRFTNEEVLNNLQSVLERIRKTLSEV